VGNICSFGKRPSSINMCFCQHVDFVGNRLLWIDSRQATLNAYKLATSSREVLHTTYEYPRHPAGLAVFEVVLKQCGSL